MQASQKMEGDKKRCEIEVFRLQEHFNAIVNKLDTIRKKHEKALRDSYNYINGGSIQNDNAQGSIGDETTDTEMFPYLLRYEAGDINEEALESMMGQTYDAEHITVTETDSFTWSSKSIVVLEAIDEDTCLLSDKDLQSVVQVKKCGKEEIKLAENVNDLCRRDEKTVFAVTKEKRIFVLLPAVPSVIICNTYPLEPLGICTTINGDLLVTLTEAKSNNYQTNSESRRLVRHVTLAGNVIHEYEYEADGQNRLFTAPYRVIQNGNTDICVINWTSDSTSELVILYFSGSLKSIYKGYSLNEEFFTTNVVCDSHSNIILCNATDSTIQLLSPEGEFMRYLLRENQVKKPTAMSLRNSALWYGDYRGLVKVF